MLEMCTSAATAEGFIMNTKLDTLEIVVQPRFIFEVTK